MSSQIIKCAFCGAFEPFDDDVKNMIIEVEWGSSWTFAHYNCVYWTPEVYILHDGGFGGVKQGMTRGRQLVHVCIRCCVIYVYSDVIYAIVRVRR